MMRGTWVWFSITVLTLILLCLYLITLPGCVSGQMSLSLIRVPQDADLQTAINLVEDNGIIEISEGTYPSPPGGFVISDLGKSFTIRAAPGEMVTLDGSGTREIMTFINTDVSRGGLVTFEDLTFANGKSTTDGRAGAVTMHRAEARFVRCTFYNNTGEQPSTGGGAVLVAINSRALFENCTWDSNTAKNFGGGLAINDNADAVVIEGLFINNSASPPTHIPTAAGGGIHVGNSRLWVYNSHFEGNRAGYVGGAIYVKGEWGSSASAVIADSSFINNAAISAYPLSFPTEGGALHVEDQSKALVVRSKFENNRAMIGGAVSVYRASIEIADSFFQDNCTFGTGAANGFGGSVSVSSNDISADGFINRPSAYLLIRDSVFMAQNSVAAQSGGAIYIAGDNNRNYGLNGVVQSGTPDENRAVASLERVLILDTSVREQPGVPGTGIGAAIMTDLADVTIKSSILAHNYAGGTDNSSGGAIAIINNSVARLLGVTLAYNQVDKFGGGIFAQGSDLRVEDNLILGNYVSNGWYGSVIFATPDDSRGLDVSGYLSGCLMTENQGLPIFDDDRDLVNGPINDVRYNANKIYVPSDSFVYRNVLMGNYTVDELNALVVVRPTCGRNTTKSQLPNALLNISPPAGALVAISPYFLPVEAPGKEHYLGFAWSGLSAELNGAALNDRAGVIKITEPGIYTLTIYGPEAARVITTEFRLLDRQAYVPLVVRGP